MHLTPEQTRVVGAPRSVAVTAGAGTGKTQMLVQRYLYHLRQGYSPLAVVAVTFTETAARELRSRLHREGQSLPNSTRAQLAAAPICTFHGLAARICREHALKVSLDPDFRILDEVEGKLWFRQALTEAIQALPPIFCHQLGYSFLTKALGALCPDPLGARAALGVSPEQTQGAVQAAQTQAWEELVQHPVWKGAQAYLASHQAPGDKLDLVRIQALSAMARVEGREDLGPALTAIRKLKINCGKQGAWGSREQLQEVKAHIKALRELTEDNTGLVTLAINPQDQAVAQQLPLLKQAFKLVQEHLKQTKGRQGVLDFPDLEVYALEALRYPEVLSYYKERWQVFLVDEFQDTNPTQSQLLELLTTGKLLTLVGDPKQSIYGFRGAQVQVFQSWQERLHTPAYPPLELRLSFRTHHSLLEQINELFAPLLGPLHQRLAAHRQAVPHPGPHLRLLLPTNEKGSRFGEARGLAQVVSTMLQAPLLVWDPQTQARRPVQPPDIAILCHTWSPLDLYAQVLEDQGIPVRQAGGGSLLETREAKDAWALLRFLADSREDLSLVALLRSPFFAFSDRTLYYLSQARHRDTCWWDHLAQALPLGESPAPLVLRQLLDQRRRASPEQLLQQADLLTGYTAVVANLPRGQRRLGDWQGFLDLVRSWEPLDLVGVVQRLEQIQESHLEIPRPAATGAGVSLTTIHQAKGLEWPVVLVANLDHRPPGRSPGLLFDPQLGVSWYQGPGGDQPAVYQLLQRRQQQMELEERKRVLYVAFTRARDHLVLTASKPKGGHLDLLPEALATPLPCASSAPSPRAQLLPVSPAHVASLGAGVWQLPISALSDYHHCPRLFEYRHLQGHPGHSRSGRGQGAALGTLTHWAIQHQVTTKENLEVAADRLGLGLVPAQVQEALDLARRFNCAPLYAPYRSPAGQAEYPVAFEFGGIHLSGYIDWLGPDYVLDFKTDRVVKPQQHCLQLWAYAYATGRQVAHLAYLRHDRVHSWGLTDLDQLTALATGVVERIARDDFSPTPSPGACQACPYGRICTAGQEFLPGPESAKVDG